MQVHGICPKTKQYEMSLFLLIYPHYFILGGKEISTLFIYLFFYTISLMFMPIDSYQSVHQRTSAHYGYYSISFPSFFVLAIYIYTLEIYT